MAPPPQMPGSNNWPGLVPPVATGPGPEPLERTTFLQFALPEVGDAELNEIRQVLASGWITTGPAAHRFEHEFAEYVGAKFAVSVNSCTAAMHLALEAAGLRAGDFVLTTPYTFAATAEVIRYFDAVPVFVDVEPSTFNIDPGQLEATIDDLHRSLAGAVPTMPAVARALATERAAAVARRGIVRSIIPVHIAGHACDMDAIGGIARQYGLSVIEDAAHACSATYKGRQVGGELTGTATNASCFSFYATKTLATGEGGMVTTGSQESADRIRMMSLHGISKDAWKRYSADGTWYYEIAAPGFKYNMPDVLAAIGLAQLRKVDVMRRRREEIARRYTEAFAAYAEVETPTVRDCVGHAWHLYMLRLNESLLRIGRDQFIEKLKKRRVGASVHFIPLHLHRYYRETYGYEPDDLPVAAREYRREVSLPVYSKMTDFDVESVIHAVTDIVREFRASVGHPLVGHQRLDCGADPV